LRRQPTVRREQPEWPPRVSHDDASNPTRISGLAAAMDWNAAIEKNREALKRILAMLVAMAGPAATSSPGTGKQGI
jgi:hypothetical protein